ncbi:MAG: ZIP zinc transporter [Betaproteobacteria bacterium HGW-Betaproteobacteria-11]|nr:MAG: ZIP zinc transporter [Betaproteobacteria bacterium HGW-Betaproteobacteria-11]
MSVLTWLIVMSLAGGVLSVLAAAAISFRAPVHWVSQLVSYAIGALLGAAFLEVLPHAITASGDATTTTATVLGGILIFFVLEKLVLWRHCHIESCEGHEPRFAPHGHGADHGRSGMLIVIGDTFHNAVDGVLIAAAFMEDVRLGIITGVAMIAHEIPQEIGDFMILLHSGYSKSRALALNILSSFAMLAGALLAYLALGQMQSMVPALLALASASMIYVAVADLIPGLHKRPELGVTLQQTLLIAAGIASIVLTHRLVDHLAG